VRAFVSATLIGDLLAVTLVGPSLLLGPAAGVPITVALFAAEGYLLRRILWARTDPAQRRRLTVRRLAKRRALANRLRSIDIDGSGLTYREVRSELGLLGLLIGGCLAGEWLVLTRPQTWPLLQVFAVMAGITMAGAVLTVVYAVHLYGRVGGWLSWPLLALLHWSIARTVAGEVIPVGIDDAEEGWTEGGTEGWAEVGEQGWAAGGSHSDGASGDGGD
jgi:hypothetical protein